MRNLRYLNTILTVIALLLAVHTWTLYAGGNPAATAWVDQAQAAGGNPPSGGGIPNAGAQRQQMVDMLKRISQQNEALIGLFRSGQARVRIEGVSAETPKRD